MKEIDTKGKQTNKQIHKQTIKQTNKPTNQPTNKQKAIFINHQYKIISHFDSPK